MAIKLASDSLSDAEVTDGIGRGDLESAARLWVRYWQTALSAARLYVDPPEVPGLAAEALVGTVSLIAIGRGPREDVASFVSSAVRELGEDDHPPMLMHADSEHPELFESVRMTSSFADLTDEDRAALRRSLAGGPETDDAEVTHALTVLQTTFLTNHLDVSPTPDCRAAHIAIMRNTMGVTSDGFARENWVHLSSCAWCTEAFHELAFSNVALDSLVAPDVLHHVDTPAPLFVEPPVELVVEPVAPAVAEAPLPALDSVILQPAEAAVLEPPPEPLIVERPGLVEVARDARHRLLAVGALALGVTIVVGLLLTKNPDTTSPASAQAGPQAATTSPAPATSGDSLGAPVGPSETVPTDGVSVAGPLEIASPTEEPTAEVEKTKAAKPTPKPSAKPTVDPAPDPEPSDPAPSEEPPASEPPPSPSPTPTKHCSALEHILGFC
ncbi:hypothetical protein ABIE44_001736 [Marmoricola sp. OAE513]|uniref:hypothetical protein n=1 Tax=Marmoricola sp. OAE513 TaxID=2817894 RepID=UPI001AE57439